MIKLHRRHTVFAQKELSQALLALTTFARGVYEDLQAIVDAIETAPSGGTGDVVGPSSATDNAIARYDGTTGELIQNSGATIDDSGNITATNLSGTNTGDQTNVTGNAGTVTVADAAGDTTMWLVLAGSQTGNQEMKSSDYLTYNDTSGVLTADGGLYTDGIIQSTKEPISAIFYGEVTAEWYGGAYGILITQYDSTYNATLNFPMGSSGAMHRGVGALTGNTTINLTGVTSGSKGYIAVIQDGTGGRTVTLTTDFGTLMRDTLCADLVAETAADAITVYEIEGYTLAGNNYTKVRKIAMVTA